MKYRPDIDGLRALAVTSVITFHAGIPAINGGYIGVDIFFVISGFLISGILLNELETHGQIEIRTFYARRIRRLFPALYAVLLTTLFASAWILTPLGPLQDLSFSAAATALYGSNIYFWRARNHYFAESSDLQPLLHTWSLGVEEQFYIVWPLLFALAWARGRHIGLTQKKSVNYLIFGTLVISLIACVIGTASHPDLGWEGWRNFYA